MSAPKPKRMLGRVHATMWTSHALTTIMDENGDFVAECSGSGSTSEESERRAARIVACVNACEGIEDPSVIPEILALLRAMEDVTFVEPQQPRLRNWKDVFTARAAEAALLIARAEGRRS